MVGVGVGVGVGVRVTVRVRGRFRGRVRAEAMARVKVRSARGGLKTVHPTLALTVAHARTRSLIESPGSPA